MKIRVFDQLGKETGSHELPTDGVRVTTGLLHQAVVRAHGNARKPIARTKDRGERSGGGKKPWKQKHTGRARQGSIRAPHWKKGGVVHGPTGEENYVTRMPKSQRRAAIRMAIKVVADAGRLHAVDALALSAPKTKLLAELLAKLPTENKRRILILTSGPHAELTRASRNLPSVKLLATDKLNVPDLLRSDCIIAVGPALADVTTALTA